MISGKILSFIFKIFLGLFKIIYPGLIILVILSIPILAYILFWLLSFCSFDFWVITKNYIFSFIEVGWIVFVIFYTLSGFFVN